jgi:hypothetical protein
MGVFSILLLLSAPWVQMFSTLVNTRSLYILPVGRETTMFQVSRIENREVNFQFILILKLYGKRREEKLNGSKDFANVVCY